MKHREKSGIFANRICSRAKRLKSSHYLKMHAAFLFFLFPYMKNMLANWPHFWTKTNLRIVVIFVYTRSQSLPKTMRLEPQEMTCFVANVESLAPFF